MVNTEKFSARLNKILNYYDISAASFADTIEVGRSSISHILSGRNKPSLDFVMKVVKNFPEVELYWLLNGKGSFPASNNESEPEKVTSVNSAAPQQIQKSENIKEKTIAFPSNKTGKQIQRIVIFYTDGSFEAFEN